MNRLSINLLHLFMWGSLLTLFISCSTTRNLPTDEVLYTGVKKFEILNDSTCAESNEALSEVEAALSYAPNNSIFGSTSYRFPFPFGIWIYNAWVNHQKGLGKWIFKRLASDPVYISKVNPEVRSKIGTNLLQNYGYFRGKVDYELLPQHNPRKEKILYKISFGPLYTLDSIAYIDFPSVADSLIRSTMSSSNLTVGSPFSVANLESERARLSTLFRNNGYYFYVAATCLDSQSPQQFHTAKHHQRKQKL